MAYKWYAQVIFYNIPEDLSIFQFIIVSKLRLQELKMQLGR